MAGRKTKHSLKTRRLMSMKAKGKNNPFYGRRHSSTTKQKISAATRGKRNPMYGRKHTKETIQKIRLARLRRFRAAK